MLPPANNDSIGLPSSHNSKGHLHCIDGLSNSCFLNFWHTCSPLGRHAMTQEALRIEAAIRPLKGMAKVCSLLSSQQRFGLARQEHAGCSGSLTSNPSHIF